MPAQNVKPNFGLVRAARGNEAEITSWKKLKMESTEYRWASRGKLPVVEWVKRGTNDGIKANKIDARFL